MAFGFLHAAIVYTMTSRQNVELSLSLLWFQDDGRVGGLFKSLTKGVKEWQHRPEVIRFRPS